MFSPYVNHALQQLAEEQWAAGNWPPLNILHPEQPLLRRSVNITKSVEKRLAEIVGSLGRRVT
jgi:hypothetical protein